MAIGVVCCGAHVRVELPPSRNARCKKMACEIYLALRCTDACA